MMHRLRPSVLDEFGLVKALQSMIDDWNSRQDDIFCHFSFSDIPNDLTELLNISLFRIVQESLTNALKHSSASKILITMNKVVSSNSEYIILNIQDDGVGLNKDKPMTGLGLPGMKERVEMNHGTFDLISEPNNGLSIKISIPINHKRCFMSNTINVMLVDDHAVVRAGYNMLLKNASEITVVAEASSGEEAYQLYSAHMPDVVVMDLIFTRDRRYRGDKTYLFSRQ